MGSLDFISIFSSAKFRNIVIFHSNFESQSIVLTAISNVQRDPIIFRFVLDIYNQYHGRRLGRPARISGGFLWASVSLMEDKAGFLEPHVKYVHLVCHAK